MTDRVTAADLKKLKTKAKYNLAKANAAGDRLSKSDVMSAEKRIRGLSLEALRDLAKGASNKGVGPLNEYMKDANKLQQKRDKIKSKLKKEDFLVGGQAKIDMNKNNRIDAQDFEILREKNKKKKGGVTSAIRKIRGIGMAKGGFKKKTPIY